jgi:succinyl-CoA--D-citramalate CoA-transferase
MSKGALSGLRVVDVSTVIAGSMASSMLADHGAEVLKIEDPRSGDPSRHLEPHKGKVSLWHKVAGRNKKSLTLNLSLPEGAQILRRLVESTDVLIENFRPGTMEKWGLGWDRLQQVNPRLIMVRISGYGQDGPYAKRPGFGTIAEAMAGLPYRCGFADGPPVLSPIALADNVAGIFAASSAMFAIYHRDHGGAGQVIDIGLYEPLFRMIEDQVIGFDQLGFVPQRQGNRLPQSAPRGTFESKDGKWVAISAFSDRTVKRLLGAIGGAALAEDPRFLTNQLRVKNVDALEALLRQWVGERTQAQVLEIFEREDVVGSGLYDIEQIFADPQILHRQNIVTVEDPDLGAVRIPGVVPKFSATPGEVTHLSVPLGHHNDEIYGESLGIDADARRKLRAAGVI